MPKPTYSKDELKREGALLQKLIEASKVKMSQEECMAELGLAQSNMSQWYKGGARVSNDNLIWLADTYGFDALLVRPSLSRYRDYFFKFGPLERLSPQDKEAVLGIIRALETKPGTGIEVVSGTHNTPRQRKNNKD